MIEIIPYNIHEDEEFDSCGNTTIAILKINSVKIPICNECISDLLKSLDEFNNKIFCHKCKNFIMSESGWNYGGSCKKDRDIDIKDAGYINCVDCMDTCQDAIKMEEK